MKIGREISRLKKSPDVKKKKKKKPAVQKENNKELYRRISVKLRNNFICRQSLTSLYQVDKKIDTEKYLQK